MCIRTHTYKDKFKFKRYVCKTLEVSAECGHISCDISCIKAQLRLRMFFSSVHSNVFVSVLTHCVTVLIQ